MNTQQNSFRYTSNNSDNAKIENAISVKPGFQLGVNLNYRVQQLGFHTGIGIMRLNEAFNFTAITEEIDTILITEKLNKIVSIYDTTKVFYYDSIPWDFPQIYVHQYDSIVWYDSLYYQADKTSIETVHQEIINHNLLEIPMFFSWEWTMKRIKLGVKAGAINQIHLYSIGKAYSNYPEVADINDVVTFTRYNLALMGGLACLVQFDKNFWIGVEANYKYPLREYSGSSIVMTRKQCYGGKAVVRYCF